MLAYLIAFFSGILTVLAPCVLPILPIIIGSSLTDQDSKKKYSRLFLIVSGLAVSVFVFTIILRTTFRFAPGLANLSDGFWAGFSGIIIILFGLATLFPNLWDRISIFFRLQSKSNGLLQKASKNQTWYGPFLLGAGLGPVFSSCSPTYFVIVGLIAGEANFWTGISFLIAYILGLSTILLAIGFTGKWLIKKLRWASNPEGSFKKGIGVFLVVFGLLIVFRLDKSLETILLNSGVYDGLQNFENSLTKGGMLIK